MLTHKWSRQNKDVASEGKGMHMSDAISAAFYDLSEISCHWALRHSLFNSARDCHVPDASVTVSPCLRAREMYLNKWAQASLVGDGNTVLHQEDFWQGCPPPHNPSPLWRCSGHVNTLKADTELYPREQSQIGSASHVTYIWWFKTDLWCLT